MSRSEYHVKLGHHVVTLIKQKGYKSVYDFWVNRAGDKVSRATLNYLAAGTGDPKLSTLILVADLLEIPLAEVFPERPTTTS